MNDYCDRQNYNIELRKHTLATTTSKYDTELPPLRVSPGQFSFTYKSTGSGSVNYSSGHRKINAIYIIIII